jgi:hypothetical protein
MYILLCKQDTSPNHTNTRFDDPVDNQTQAPLPYKHTEALRTSRYDPE